MTDMENRIGYRFRDPALLELALTHSSYANERGEGRLRCNERLEFLGDSLLGFLVAEYMYKNMPDKPEGEMTRIRAELVCEKSLVEIARRLRFGERIRLGKGEELAGGRSRVSILADAVEAVLAAIYLDGGMREARAFVDRILLNRLKGGAAVENNDHKTMLQELVQRHGGAAPVYKLVGESGPDHDKVFYAEVAIRGETMGSGSGRSKKEAEQAAAGAALARLQS